MEPNSVATGLHARAKAKEALLLIGNSDIVDPMIGRLLPPVPIESESNFLAYFVRGRAIEMKGLPGLHVSDAESSNTDRYC
jgi:hypothetical protein